MGATQGVDVKVRSSCKQGQRVFLDKSLFKLSVQAAAKLGLQKALIQSPKMKLTMRLSGDGQEDYVVVEVESNREFLNEKVIFQLVNDDFFSLDSQSGSLVELQEVAKLIKDQGGSINIINLDNKVKGVLVQLKLKCFKEEEQAMAAQRKE
mmetsp:Transcript_13529/g.23026  ORF Transcript_13529/g.23026 Transcript_13529/m.23026 type:complete len:151 (+) Transcript_13529:391-843(+)